MQLEDAAIRPFLHESIVGAWDVQGLRPDRQRIANAAAQFPKARVELQDGVSQPIGGAAASKAAILPHTYRITGTFRYPAEGANTTINELAVEKWNSLVFVLTENYPFYFDWRYSEEIGWEFEDDPTEEVYSVTVTFTLEVISPVNSNVHA